MQATTYRATHLRDLIDAKGLRHGWVAKQAGISKFVMSTYVNRHRPVPADRAQLIAQALGVPLFFVFESLESDESSPHGDGVAA